MAEHDHHGCAEQRPLGAEEAVRDPAAQDRGGVHQTAVRADDRGGDLLGVAESAVADRVVDVVRQQTLHAVETEPLPQFDPRQVRQSEWVAEEPAVRIGESHLGIPSCHVRQ